MRCSVGPIDLGSEAFPYLIALEGSVLVLALAYGGGLSTTIWSRQFGTPNSLMAPPPPKALRKFKIKDDGFCNLWGMLKRWKMIFTG